MKNKAVRACILPLMIIICSVFYYFGELADWAAWGSLRNTFFYSIHDVHRLLFLAPIVYAGYTAKIRGAIIITLVSFIIFLPRAFFISPYPDPLLRMIMFTVFAGVIGVLLGHIRNQTCRCRQMEIRESRERERMLKILNGLADGVVITDQDYKIRFMNANLVKDYGEGTGLPCYRHLRGNDRPCQETCRIRDVIDKRKVLHWECRFPNGKTYEILAAPYTDSDGTECQISVFRDSGQ